MTGDAMSDESRADEWTERESDLLEEAVQEAVDTMSKKQRALEEKVTTEQQVLWQIIHRPVFTRFSGTDRAVFVVAIFLMLVLPWLLASAVFQPQTPEVTVRPPNVNIDAAELAAAMTVPAYERDPESGLLVPMPEPARDAAAFRRNCEDVCRASQWRRSNQEQPEARVLVADPERQVCTCFTGAAVFRYVGWRRQP